MCRMTDEDIQKGFEECSMRSEAELLDELSDADIPDEEFQNFVDMISPMLDDAQMQKLEEIRKAMTERE